MKTNDNEPKTGSLKAAKLEAAARRAAGEQVKILKESGTYTQPGRGVVGYVTFYVVAK